MSDKFERENNTRIIANEQDLIREGFSGINQSSVLESGFEMVGGPADSSAVFGSKPTFRQKQVLEIDKAMMTKTDSNDLIKK